jgi:archaellum biogenesis protein FlaJ (TadC family)
MIIIEMIAVSVYGPQEEVYNEEWMNMLISTTFFVGAHALLVCICAESSRVRVIVGLAFLLVMIANVMSIMFIHYHTTNIRPKMSDLLPLPMTGEPVKPRAHPPFYSGLSTVRDINIVVLVVLVLLVLGAPMTLYSMLVITSFPASMALTILCLLYTRGASPSDPTSNLFNSDAVCRFASPCPLSVTLA